MPEQAWRFPDTDVSLYSRRLAAVASSSASPVCSNGAAVEIPMLPIVHPASLLGTDEICTVSLTAEVCPTSALSKNAKMQSAYTPPTLVDCRLIIGCLPLGS